MSGAGGRLSEAFLDEVRARTNLSALIGRTVKLERAGREMKACCPFHDEATASFYVNDAKGFYHCFGCGAHGDAIRWLVETKGLEFLDAVRQLAGEAGIEMPVRSAEAEARERARAAKLPLLEAAARWYGEQLRGHPPARDYLVARGIDDELVARFGLGWAPGGSASVARGIGCTDMVALAEVGLVTEAESGGYRDFLWKRVTIPVRDARGRVVGFAGRGIAADSVPKYVNSPDGPLFDKSRLLFNLDRAAEAARKAKRLLIVEGQFDCVTLSGAGIDEAVAPMGSALTEAQMLLAWRVHACPVLVFDGDAAGAAAAVKACTRALPGIGPGRSFRVATLGEGEDPDSLVRTHGREGIDVAVLGARPLDEHLFDAICASAALDTPEGRAGVWETLATLARSIAHDETRAQFLGMWRARFDRRFPLVEPAPDPETGEIAVLRAVNPLTMDHAGEDESERRFVAIVRRRLQLRAERRAIGEDLKELQKLSELSGFATKAVNAVVASIEADEKAGSSEPREIVEAATALYRRVLGVHGPMTAAMMPRDVEPRRERAVSATLRRVDSTMRLIAAQAQVEA
jgi:DNA primase